MEPSWTAILLVPFEHEDGCQRVAAKFFDAQRFPAKNCLSVYGRVTPFPQPHHLGWRSERGREFKEIRIRSYDGETRLLGVIPDFGVGPLTKSKVLDVRGIRIEIRKPKNQLAREIFVKE
jgi:hypothetical protein